FLLKAMYVDQPLIQVNKDFLTEWREQRLLNVKGATVRREFILLSAFFTWCIEVKRWLSVNPLRDIKFPCTTIFCKV
ncbi:phage integrase, partial [Escherichia sp. R-CC3]